MAETGRAAVYAGKKQPFEIREYPVPDPGERDVVVRVEQANVCGSDLHIWRGDTDLEAIGRHHGVILGHEMVGRVHRLGSGVRTDALGRPLAEGDRVVYPYYVYCGRCRPCARGDYHMCLASLSSPIRSCDDPPHFLGGLADYYYVRSRQPLFKIPEDIPASMVAGANCALSQVIHGYDVAALRLGERVVVQGAGGLGLLACAVARELGAGQIIAIDGVPARLELARRFGADEVVDMREHVDSKARGARVAELTGGGADLVVEMVGHPDAVPEGIRMLERGGRYLEMGNINPRHSCKLDPSLLVCSNRSVLGVSLYPAPVLPRAVDFLARTRDRYPFDELVSHRYPLARATEAFMESDTFESRDRAVTRAAVVPGDM